MAPNPAAVSGSHPQTQTLATQGMQQAVRVRFLLRTGGDRLLGIYQRRRRKWGRRDKTGPERAASPGGGSSTALRYCRAPADSGWLPRGEGRV